MATEQKGIIFNLKLKVIGVKRPWDSYQEEKQEVFFDKEETVLKKSKKLRAVRKESLYN